MNGTSTPTRTAENETESTRAGDETRLGVARAHIYEGPGIYCICEGCGFSMTVVFSSVRLQRIRHCPDCGASVIGLTQ